MNEYLIDLNGTQAAIRTGYAAKNADVMASKLLAKPDVKALVKEKLEAREQKTIITAEYVLSNLKEVVERCMQRSPVMEFDRVAKAMVQKMAENDNGKEVGLFEFDSNGANRALELLGRHLKLFDDGAPLLGVPMVINIVPATYSKARVPSH